MENILTKLADKTKRFCSRFYKVPYCVPAWGWAEHWAIFKCLLMGRIIEGPDKEKLYGMIREKTGMKYVFGFNSGQEAITAALKAWGICLEDKVIMPSYCCETVAWAVLATGAQPLFCDIDENFNPDVNHIMSILDSSVKAIIFPHLFGNPGAIDKLENALVEKGVRSEILLIDDAAQSFGARLHGKFLVTFGDAGIISFGPGKTMTATGGGLLITSNKKKATKIASLSLGRLNPYEKLKKIIYWVIFRRWRKFTLPFYPYLKKFLKNASDTDKNIKKICNVDASIAIKQLSKLDALLKTRIKRMTTLNETIQKYKHALLPSSLDTDSTSASTKYCARILNDELIHIQAHYENYMSRRGIELFCLYLPIHIKEEFQKESCSLPRTEKNYRLLLQIPVEPSMCDSSFHFVKNKFCEFADGCGLNQPSASQ